MTSGGAEKALRHKVFNLVLKSRSVHELSFIRIRTVTYCSTGCHPAWVSTSNIANEFSLNEMRSMNPQC